MSKSIPTITNQCPSCKREFTTWAGMTQKHPTDDRPCYACDMVAKGHAGVLKAKGVLIPEVSK